MYPTQDEINLPLHQNGRCIYLRAYVIIDRKIYNFPFFLDLLLRLTDSVSSYKFLKKLKFLDNSMVSDEVKGKCR